MPNQFWFNAFHDRLFGKEFKSKEQRYQTAMID